MFDGHFRQDPEADWSCAGDGTWQLLSPALACEDIDECAVTSPHEHFLAS